MKFKTKVAILMLAVFLSLVGFNLIASFVPPELLKAKNVGTHEVKPDVLARVETVVLHSDLI